MQPFRAAITAPSGKPAAPSGKPAAPFRRRPRKKSPPAPPLGSLTQLQSRAVCTACGSSRVTHVAMNLTDGTPVVFSSCHRCEVHIWEHDGQAISVTDVLERTRKPA